MRLDDFWPLDAASELSENKEARRHCMKGSIVGAAAIGLLVAFYALLPTSSTSRQPSTSTHRQPHSLEHGLKLYLPPGTRLSIEPPAPFQLDSLTPEYHSQVAQDAYVEAYFFSGLKGGRYIELGAKDGSDHSNTWLFMQAHGWTGTMIEANPTTYKELLKNRPNDVCVHAAVCSASTDLHFVDDGNHYTGVARVRRFGMLLVVSRTRSGIFEFMSEPFKHQYYSNIKTAEDIDRITTEHVSCRPLREILTALEVEHVNYFSLDVEGSELLVLESIDWSKVKIDVIMVEIYLGDPQHIAEEENLLEAQGFVRFNEQPTQKMVEHHPQVASAHALDAYFVHRDYLQEAQERFRQRQAAGLA